MKIAIQKNAQILAAFAVVCTAMVALIDLLTADKIAQQEQLQLLNSLHQVIDPKRLNNDLYHDCKYITNEEYLGSVDEQTAYIARMDNVPIAIALTAVAPDGYNGKINLMIAINMDGSVSGVRVLKHAETPGLGDKIETRKSDWVYTFNNKAFTGDNDLRWQVKKDGGMFDQFTGATITPRAIVIAVKNTLLYFNAHKDTLTSNTETCRGSYD